MTEMCDLLSTPGLRYQFTQQSTGSLLQPAVTNGSPFAVAIVRDGNVLARGDGVALAPASFGQDSIASLVGDSVASHRYSATFRGLFVILGGALAVAEGHAAQCIHQSRLRYPRATASRPGVVAAISIHSGSRRIHGEKPNC